jgi:hypothetical protein
MYQYLQPKLFVSLIIFTEGGKRFYTLLRKSAQTVIDP